MLFLFVLNLLAIAFGSRTNTQKVIASLSQKAYARTTSNTSIEGLAYLDENTHTIQRNVNESTSQEAWMRLMDFLSTKTLQMSWEGALKAFKLITNAVAQIHKLHGISHCNWNLGNINILVDESQPLIDDVQFVRRIMIISSTCRTFADFRGLRFLFFQLLADASLEVRDRFSKWHQSVQTINASDVDAIQDFEWWAATNILSDKQCPLCQVHAPKLAKLFEGELGGGISEDVDASRQGEYIDKLNVRLSQLIYDEFIG